MNIIRKCSEAVLREWGQRKNQKIPFERLIALIFFIYNGPAAAQDATWLAGPGNNDFNTGGNWSLGAVPTGTAFFGASTTTSLEITAGTTFGGLTLNSDAPGYTFDTNATLQINGAGIINNSTAGSVNFVNDSGNTIEFSSSSTAGNASITIDNSSFVNFRNTSLAGNASFVVQGTSALNFRNSTTASGSSITNNNGGFLNFFDSGTAGNSSITNNNGGTLRFFSSGTAGSANITNNSGGSVIFNANSTAGDGRLLNNAGGTVDFSATSGPLGVQSRHVVGWI